MTVGRKLKRNIFIDTDIDCQNCGCWQRVCTWNGECDNLEPMTNEEWLRSISTRELAKNLALLVLYDMPLYDRLHNSFEGGESAVIDACEKWLKEKHDEM